MRKRWIQINGELVPADECNTYVAPMAPTVRGDYQPYKSMITGEMIEGRRQHRDHLKAHNCVEVGNELDKAKPKAVDAPIAGLREQIAREVYSRLSY